MNIDDINKFLAHLYKTSIDVAKREQDNRPIPYDITVFTNGETLTLPFNKSTCKETEKLLLNLRESKSRH